MEYYASPRSAKPNGIMKLSSDFFVGDSMLHSHGFQVRRGGFVVWGGDAVSSCGEETRGEACQAVRRVVKRGEGGDGMMRLLWCV
jgi:hypothetical protein